MADNFCIAFNRHVPEIMEGLGAYGCDREVLTMTMA